MTDSNLAARVRMTRKFMRRLDRVEAARRLTCLLDANGKPNPVHEASYFRVKWNNQRFVDKLVNWRRRRDMREGRVAGWGWSHHYRESR